MLKRLCITLIFCTTVSVFAAEAAKPAVPEIFSETDLNGENPKFLEEFLIIANFEQRLQMADGKLSKRKGRVLVIDKDGTMHIAFYFQTDSGKYRRIGRILAIKDTGFPRQDIHPEYNIPCLILNKNNNEGAFRVYLYNGNTVIQKVRD